MVRIFDPDIRVAFFKNEFLPQAADLNASSSGSLSEIS